MSSFPVLVILGASGSGKSAVADALGRRLELRVVEVEAIVAERAGVPLGEMMTDSPEDALEALAVASQDELAEGGPGAGAIVVLSPSAVLNPGVMEALEAAKAAGTKVTALRASLSSLVRRNGLDAIRPTNLGTPRAWFRTQLSSLEEAYSKVADVWCDTDTCDSAMAARLIAADLGFSFPARMPD